MFTTRRLGRVAAVRTATTPAARLRPTRSFAAASEKAKDLEQYKKHLCPGIGRVSDSIMTRGVGSSVHLSDGRELIDFASGIGVTNTSHCHPTVVKAIQDQAAKLLHCPVGIAHHEPMLELVRELLKIVPEELNNFFFYSSGSEAVEAAIKVARAYTKRQNVIVFNGAFHGRTLGTMPLTSSKLVFRAHFGPFMPGVHSVPYPYCVRCKSKSLSGDKCCNTPIDEIKRLFATTVGPDEVAAIIVEPIQGEGGYVVPPDGFFEQLREIADEHGIVLVFDEVQTGFGRSGKMFATEHRDVVPDIMIMAKGLASGLPLSGIAARPHMMAACPPGSMAGTYAGNAVSCAAAVATQQVFREEKLVENSAKMGEYLIGKLNEIADEHKSIVFDVRGRGLMLAMEFRDSVGPGFATRLSKNCFEEGLVILTCGPHETVRFISPLTVNEQTIDQAMDAFKAGLQKTIDA